MNCAIKLNQVLFGFIKLALFVESTPRLSKLIRNSFNSRASINVYYLSGINIYELRTRTGCGVYITLKYTYKTNVFVNFTLSVQRHRHLATQSICNASILELAR